MAVEGRKQRALIQVQDQRGLQTARAPAEKVEDADAVAAPLRNPEI
jgi:hypothetical protein